MIKLVCNSYWFSLIESNKINFDYRKMNDYYMSRFVKKNISNKHEIVFKELNKVTFVQGYSRNRKEITRTIKSIEISNIPSIGNCFIINFENTTKHDQQTRKINYRI